MSNIQKFLFTLGLLLGMTAEAGAVQVHDPMKYSVEQSRFYSEGDSNDPSGWDGCEYVSSQPATVDIQCSGSREILIHGGHMVKSEFTCSFEFKQNVNFRSYEILDELCD